MPAWGQWYVSAPDVPVLRMLGRLTMPDKDHCHRVVRHNELSTPCRWPDALCLPGSYQEPPPPPPPPPPEEELDEKPLPPPDDELLTGVLDVLTALENDVYEAVNPA